jgi:hypothetical protein
MNTFLSHFSAASYWQIPHIEEVLALDKNDFDLVYNTVSSRGKKYVKKGHKIYLSMMKLPEGGVIKVDHIFVASPELVFLQLSSHISLHRLILLGLQLCSFPPGCPDKAITTKNKLRKFIDKVPGHPGRQNSQRALKYIEDGSASLMESLAYMILCLPHTLGGYGLSGAVFNYKVQLKGEATQLLGQRYCFIDIFYKQEKVAVEYDSFSFHNNPTAQGRDAIRSEVLHKMGFEMMHLKTIQLYNLKACDDFVINLSRRLGRRIRFRAKKYETMRSQLRALLPHESFTGGWRVT